MNQSWWSQGSGHNCTNYVAWRLTTAGVPYYNVQGNATAWDTRSRDAGKTVDHTAAVRAIAQWEASPSMPYGHVAWVESVNIAAGTITVSEDNAGGSYHWKTYDIDSPSWYIHTGASAPPPAGQTQLRSLGQVTATSTGWSQAWTGVTARPTAMSAVDMGGGQPMIMSVSEGTLWQTYATSNGWLHQNTGVQLSSTASISAVNMGGSSQPQIMAIDGGYVWQIVATANGWVKGNTGIQASGQISSVYMPGYGWPMSMVASGGQLYQVWGDNNGWHIMGTGLSIDGPISAVYMGGSAPMVMSLEGGNLYQIFAGSNGWTRMGTGIQASGTLSAVNMGGDQPQVFISSGGQLYQVFAGNGWQIMGMGVGSYELFSALKVGQYDTAQILNFI